MSEASWLAAEDPIPMLDFLNAGLIRPGVSLASPRKLRLFACACSLLLPNRTPRLRRAVEAALAFADGELGTAEMEAARWEQPPGPWTVCNPDAGEAAYHVIRDDSLTGRRAEMAALLREIFGNPFRPVRLLYRQSCPPSCRVTSTPCLEARGGPLRVCGGCGYPWECPWLTPTALSVARRAYDDRDFAALPVLRDALLDAGCEDEHILAHLLEPMHARGCWVLDLVLGKC